MFVTFPRFSYFMMSHNWNVVQKLASIPKGAKTALAEVYKASFFGITAIPILRTASAEGQQAREGFLGP